MAGWGVAAAALVCAPVAAVAAANGWMLLRMSSRIMRPHELSAAEPWPAAIVPGARVWPSGRPCTMLEDRLRTAADLFEKGLVKKLYLSGNDDASSCHEVTAMALWLGAQGIPAEALICDPAGRRTILTMLHARQAGIRRACIVTQRFHLPRALWLAYAAGIDAVGVEADRQHYRAGPLWRARIREIGARLLAFAEARQLSRRLREAQP